LGCQKRPKRPIGKAFKLKGFLRDEFDNLRQVAIGSIENGFGYQCGWNRNEWLRMAFIK
jgi:hypothetical protein